MTVEYADLTDAKVVRCRSTSARTKQSEAYANSMPAAVFAEAAHLTVGGSHYSDTLTVRQTCQYISGLACN